MQTQTKEIRRRRDGSIDTPHYIDVAHTLRSQEICTMLRRGFIRLTQAMLDKLRAPRGISMSQ